MVFCNCNNCKKKSARTGKGEGLNVSSRTFRRHNELENQNIIFDNTKSSDNTESSDNTDNSKKNLEKISSNTM